MNVERKSAVDKWYYNSWFLALLFVFWQSGVTLIIGAVLTHKKNKIIKGTLGDVENVEMLDAESKRLGGVVDELKFKIENMESTYESEFEKAVSRANAEAENQADAIIAEATAQVENMEVEIANKDEKYAEVLSLNKKIDSQKNRLSKLASVYKGIQNTLKKYAEIPDANVELILSPEELEAIESIGFDPNISLKLRSMDVKSLRKAFNLNKKVVDETLSRYEGKYNTKANSAIYKLMVIALKAELQNVLYNLKYDKLDNSIDTIREITEKYFQIASEGNQQIAPTMARFIGELEVLFVDAVKIEYEYYVKKEREKAEQAALREQMKQEVEERNALKQQQEQMEREEAKYLSEIERVQEQLAQSAIDSESNRQLQEKILELQAQLESVEHKKEDILSRQNGKAGNVYVISNIGSFGKDVFKIGMTRRLDPMDRVKELSSASVPFPFNVHSFIFSEDAVGLEQRLHSALDEKRLNKINLRKEFFSTSLDHLENLVSEIDPTAEFNRTIMAEEYSQTLSLNN